MEKHTLADTAFTVTDILRHRFEVQDMTASTANLTDEEYAELKFTGVTGTSQFMMRVLNSTSNHDYKRLLHATENPIKRLHDFILEKFPDEPNMEAIKEFIETELIEQFARSES